MGPGTVDTSGPIGREAWRNEDDRRSFGESLLSKSWKHIRSIVEVGSCILILQKLGMKRIGDINAMTTVEQSKLHLNCQMYLKMYHVTMRE